jgi:GNAT superfamily N-acetyltransferase
MKVDLEYLRSLTIKTFDAARHDRAAFTCGEERIDNFLKITASRYVAGDVGRIYVATEKDGGRLVGFYAVNPHAIDACELEASMIKRLPRLDRLPTFYLSMIGAHVDTRSKGVGSYLLADALKRCMRISDKVGGRFVVLDGISDRTAQLYGRYGFVPLPSIPGRMVVSMAKLKANEAARLERRDPTAGAAAT